MSWGEQGDESSNENTGDGGLSPGGAPDTPCNGGPCPTCADDRQRSSGCALRSGHDGVHRCPYGDTFVESANKCLDLCPQFDGWCIRDKGHEGVHWCGRHEW
jgi:hypothetical protein